MHLIALNRNKTNEIKIKLLMLTFKAMTHWKWKKCIKFQFTKCFRRSTNVFKVLCFRIEFYAVTNLLYFPPLNCTTENVSAYICLYNGFKKQNALQKIPTNHCRSDKHEVHISLSPQTVTHLFHHGESWCWPSFKPDTDLLRVCADPVTARRKIKTFINYQRGHEKYQEKKGSVVQRLIF